MRARGSGTRTALDHDDTHQVRSDALASAPDTGAHRGARIGEGDRATGRGRVYPSGRVLIHAHDPRAVVGDALTGIGLTRTLIAGVVIAGDVIAGVVGVVGVLVSRAVPRVALTALARRLHVGADVDAPAGEPSGEAGVLPSFPIASESW